MTSNANNTGDAGEGRGGAVGAALEAMSRPPGVEVALWRAALEQSRREGTTPEQRAQENATSLGGVGTRPGEGAARTALPRVFTRRLSPRVSAAAMICLLVVVSGVLLLPSLGKARSSARSDSLVLPNAAVPVTDAIMSSHESRLQRPLEASVAPASSQVPSGASSLDRMVVRKVSIDLTVEEVGSAFQKAQLLISEGSGEYIEQSSLLTPNENQGKAGATITLRVRSERVGAILLRIRELGEVRAETASGDDVTDQAVDLDARITNERRVEAELLQLLDSRAQGGLSDILALRANLNQVREGIERLVAQRDRLSKQAALATILITLREHGKPAEPGATAPGLATQFSKSIGDAWHDALALLIDAASFIVRVMVGGLPFWAGLLLVAALARRLWRWSGQRAAQEPAPTW